LLRLAAQGGERWVGAEPAQGAPVSQRVWDARRTNDEFVASQETKSSFDYAGERGARDWGPVA
jgi:hypothetical protein